MQNNRQELIVESPVCLLIVKLLGSSVNQLAALRQIYKHLLLIYKN